MSDSPSVDQFIRHMQAELDSCETIVDKNEREKRQWQIESALMHAIDFKRRFVDLSKLGEDPLKIVKALAMNDINSTELKQNEIATNGFCPRCNMPMEADLDFCPNCGDYQN
ncbi:MAG: hypothetical protein CMB20_001035 [Methanobacteriota archaeon]|nr:MAG: hypothetical protein CMB20_001035 [Euryarchaeota archaeon]